MHDMSKFVGTEKVIVVGRFLNRCYLQTALFGAYLPQLKPFLLGRLYIGKLPILDTAFNFQIA